MIPLQKTASDILGLEYQELNYSVNLPKMERPIEEKYVVFAPNATAGCKEWVYENWVEVTKFLKSEGYDVVTLTTKPYYIEGAINIYGKSDWNEIFNYLYHSEFLIGLSSTVLLKCEVINQLNTCE